MGLTDEYNGRDKAHCCLCGWVGTLGDCGFGHKDIYCPKCGKETVDIDNGQCY